MEAPSNGEKFEVVILTKLGLTMCRALPRPCAVLSGMVDIEMSISPLPCT